MKQLIKIGVHNFCTPISLFVPPTLHVKNPPVKNFSGLTGWAGLTVITRKSM